MILRILIGLHRTYTINIRSLSMGPFQFKIYSKKSSKHTYYIHIKTKEVSESLENGILIKKNDQSIFWWDLEIIQVSDPVKKFFFFIFLYLIHPPPKIIFLSLLVSKTQFNFMPNR